MKTDCLSIEMISTVTFYAKITLYLISFYCHSSAPVAGRYMWIVVNLYFFCKGNYTFFHFTAIPSASVARLVPVHTAWSVRIKQAFKKMTFVISFLKMIPCFSITAFWLEGFLR